MVGRVCTKPLFQDLIDNLCRAISLRMVTKHAGVFLGVFLGVVNMSDDHEGNEGVDGHR
jgi:hypothetical protein